MPLKVHILYQDDCFVVFDKPAGLLVIPTPRQEKNTLLDIVNVREKETDPHLYPCHRLDRETSGAIIFAKGKHNQQILMDQFREQRVKKTYLAFVQGRLSRPSGEIKSAIKDFDEKKFRRNSPPKMALTRYTVLESYQDFCLVEVEPLTGRTNQIRIQFSEMGHPLVGERKYAFARDFKVKFRRTALHAYQVEFYNPSLNKTIKITAPLPKDMEEFLERNKN